MRDKFEQMEKAGVFMILMLETAKMLLEANITKQLALMEKLMLTAVIIVIKFVLKKL